MTKAKHFILYLMAVILAAGVAGCKKESEQVKEPTPQEEPTPGPGEKPGKDTPAYYETENVHLFNNVVVTSTSELLGIESDTVSGHFTITYSEKVPDIKKGSVVVVEDEEGHSEIILVTDANIDGNTANLNGVIGDISYLYHDTEFYIASDLSVVDDAAGVEIYVPEMPKKSLGKASGLESDPLKYFNCTDKFKITDFEFYGDIDFFNNSTEDNFEVGFKAEASVAMKIKVNDLFSIKPNIGIKSELAVVYHQKFEDTETIVINGVEFQKSKVMSSEFYLDGYFGLKPEVTFEASVKGSLVKQEHEYICELVKPKMFTVPALPGVTLVLACDLFTDLNVTASAKLTATSKFELGFHGRFGFSKLKDDSYDLIHKFELVDPEDESIADESDVSCQEYAELKGSFATYPVFSVSFESKKLLGLGGAVKFPASVSIGIGNKVDKKNMVYGATGSSIDVKCTMTAGAVHERWLKKELLYFPLPLGISYDDGKISYSSKETDVDIFPTFFKAETPGALFVQNISDGKNSQSFIGKYRDCVNLENIKDNFIQFPVRKDVPIDIEYAMLSKLSFFERASFVYNGAFPPNRIEITSKYGAMDGRIDEVWGIYPKYRWVPKADDDYLVAKVYDYKGKMKGYVKIANENRDMDDHIIIVNLPVSQIFQYDKLHVSGSLKEKCDLKVSVTVDNFLGGYESERTPIIDGNVFVVDLPTGVDGPVHVKLTAIKDGEEIDSYTFHYTVVGAKLTSTISADNVRQGAELRGNVISNIKGKLKVYVDDVEICSSGDDKMDYSFDLPSDVPGEHEVAVRLILDDLAVKTDYLFYTVIEKTETDASVSPSLPDVSGSKLENAGQASGTASDVKGQDVNQSYSGSGSAPDVKGENLDQIYNGSGSAPDVKGTNL